jgi:hypothetical protein
MTLMDLKREVDLQAKRYLPDFFYTASNRDQLRFEVVAIHDMVGDPAEPDTVGLVIQNPALNEAAPVQYLTNEWSRHQLLQAVGTKEKWFEHVSLELQASELNNRRHVLENMMFRTMSGGDEEAFPVRPIRGIVSDVYCDLPCTDIMQALVDEMPGDTVVLRRFSGQTDRSFYAYILLDQPIGLPGQHDGYPGLIFRNSEVGYTSLWVIPFLLLPWMERVAVLEKKYLLRRIHRGKINDLREMFSQALSDASVLWADLQHKLPRLSQNAYASEDDALEAMSRLIFQSAGGTKLFAQRCREAYKASGYRAHSAYTIFETITNVAGSNLNPDKSYDHNAIAGSILLRLVL